MAYSSPPMNHLIGMDLSRESDMVEPPTDWNQLEKMGFDFWRCLFSCIFCEWEHWYEQDKIQWGQTELTMSKLSPEFIACIIFVHSEHPRDVGINRIYHVVSILKILHWLMKRKNSGNCHCNVDENDHQSLTHLKEVVKSGTLYSAAIQWNGGCLKQ